jgi:hypothetical protein
MTDSQGTCRWGVLGTASIARKVVGAMQQA